MCDKSEDITMPKPVLDFLVSDPPKGMKSYVLDDLTRREQTQLNEEKIDTIRENNEYLHAHPEVRAIVALIFRVLLKERPESNFHEAIVRNLFLKPLNDLRGEVEEYISERKSLVKKGKIHIHGKMSSPDSRRRMRRQKSGDGSEESEADGVIQSEEPEVMKIWPEDALQIGKDMVEEVLEQVHQYAEKQEKEKSVKKTEDKKYKRYSRTTSYYDDDADDNDDDDIVDVHDYALNYLRDDTFDMDFTITKTGSLETYHSDTATERSSLG